MDKQIDYFRTNKITGKLPGFEDDMDPEQLENKLKEENYYKYHENVQDYDPRG